MNNRNNKIKVVKDYLGFKETQPVLVPAKLSERTRSLVLDRLNPGGFLIFRKLVVIHGIFGFLSLAICHQMGMNPFGTKFSLHSIMMDILGHMGCSVFCGFWFIGGSIAVSYFFLSQDEVRGLKSRKWSQNFVLSLMSLFIFSLFGVELFSAESLLWLVGALSGGVIGSRLLSQRAAV